MNFSLIFVYLISILLFMNFNSLFIFWIFMEMNMIFFILIISNISLANIETEFSFNECLYYLFIQSLSSFIFLFSLIFNDYSMFFLIMVFISILIKMGIFPFHFWMYNICLNISSISFVFLLTFQKVPFFFLISVLDLDFSFFIFLANLIFGSSFIYFSKSFEHIIVSSSIYSTFWFVIFYLFSMNSFMLFFLSYFISIIILCSFKSNFKIFESSYLKLFFYVLSILFLMGMPPIFFFFLKFFSFNLILLMMDKFFLMLVWIFVFFSFVGYFFFFYKNFFFNSTMYFHLEQQTKFYCFFSFFLFFFNFLLF